MKLSDKGFSIEARDFYHGCQDMSNFPDAPFAASEFLAGKNVVKIVPAKLAPIENTILEKSTAGLNVYAQLSKIDFFYLVVIVNGDIEEAFVPDDIFDTATDAEAFGLLHQIEYAAIR